MTGEIRNPAKLPTDLNPVEKEFARCLATGEFGIIGDGELPKKGIESGEDANVVRSEVIRFFAYGGNEETSVSGSIICLQGAWISGDLNLIHASIPYVLWFRNCHFVASVMMPHMECAGLYLSGSRLVQGLFADGLTTKGSVYLRDGFSAEGEVRLLGANIGGDLDCVGGKFNKSGGRALSADKLTTKGNVLLQNGFSAKGEVRLLGANIGGDLGCEGGKFHNPGGDAFYVDGLTTKGNVHLRNGFSAKGEVRLLGANIGGNLDCEDGKFHNSGEYALSADNLTTKRNVNLRNGFSAEGEVSLLGANVGGDLDCVNGKFNNANGRAFSADKLTTKGSVNLRDGFSAEGEVRLLGANIGGNLDCENGRFNNANGDAFSADRLTTKGNVHFRNGFSAAGEVQLSGANIGGSLNCSGGQFNNPNGHALAIEGSNINVNLFWRNTTCKGDVNLAYVRVDVLSDDLDSWKSCKVILDGFTYNRFFNYGGTDFRIDWLDNRPDGMGFSPLPYEQAAKVLFGMGRASDAREILLKKERLQTKDGKMPWLQRVGRRLWNVFAGYGYRLRYTLGWMAFCIYVGTSVFLDADLQHRIVPHQPVVLANPAYQYAVRKGAHPTEFVPTMFSGYPKFNQRWFSVDIVAIPLFNLPQQTHWFFSALDECVGFPIGGG